MQTSILIEKQKSVSAELGRFHNWQLPKFYTSEKKEYATAKAGVVLMDRSYFEHIRISGSDQVDLLHRLTTNEVRTLKPGEGQLNIFTNEKGRIVDRVLLFKFETEIHLITAAGQAQKVADWLEKYVFIEDVKTDIVSNRGVLSLFGPKAAQFLSEMFKVKLEGLGDHHFYEVEWNNHNLQIARSAELRLPGFNLIVEESALQALWDYLRENGSQFDLEPMGEEAYETLRIESGWPLYGKDFDGEVNPHEAQMLPYVDFDKGCYIGQEVVARLDTYEKVQKYLMGLVLEGADPPNEKDPIFINEQEVGYVTSVTHSFDLNKSLALGYVRTKFIDEGAGVLVHSGGNKIAGKLVKLPFEI